MTDPRHAHRAPPEAGTYLRQIKSYVLRTGRVGPGQQRAFDQFGPRFLLAYDAGQKLDPAAVFGRQAPLIMEIGFGMGNATAEIAKVRPQDNFLCCEVHEPGVGALLKLCGEQNIENIRKPFGAGDDPLNQRATTGWKAWFTAKILNDAFLVRIEAGVTA